MTRDDIIRLAQEAGFIRVVATEEGGAVTTTIAPIEELERFSALVAAAEREACAKVCDGIQYNGYCPPEDGAAPDYYNSAAAECAAIIRARGYA